MKSSSCAYKLIKDIGKISAEDIEKGIKEREYMKLEICRLWELPKTQFIPTRVQQTALNSLKSN